MTASVTTLASGEMSLSPIIVSAPPCTCCLVTAHPLHISINQDNSPSPPHSVQCTVPLHFYIFQKFHHSLSIASEQKMPTCHNFYLVWAAPLRHKLSWDLILPEANCAVRRGAGRGTDHWPGIRAWCLLSSCISY